MDMAAGRLRGATAAPEDSAVEDLLGMLANLLQPLLANDAWRCARNGLPPA